MRSDCLLGKIKMGYNVKYCGYSFTSSPKDPRYVSRHEVVWDASGKLMTEIESDNLNVNIAGIVQW